METWLLLHPLSRFLTELLLSINELEWQVNFFPKSLRKFPSITVTIGGNAADKSLVFFPLFLCFFLCFLFFCPLHVLIFVPYLFKPLHARLCIVESPLTYLAQSGLLNAAAEWRLLCCFSSSDIPRIPDSSHPPLESSRYRHSGCT